MSSIFAVRTTIGQEKNVADMLGIRAEKENLLVYSILVPSDIRGYIFVEAENKTEVNKVIRNVNHVKGVVEGIVALEDIERFFEPKPTIVKVDVGDIVELISGPFKGEKARIIRVDPKKEELTVELLEATVPIPVTVKADSVKIVRKGGE